MKIGHTLNTEFLHDKEIPCNAVILTLNNKTQLIGLNFNRPRKYKLELLVWLPVQQKWIKAYEKNNFTDLMWDYYRKNVCKRKSHTNYEHLMKHDRKQKHGSGGSHIYNGSITDYECTKNPFHDFRRSMCVQWN